MKELSLKCEIAVSFKDHSTLDCIRKALAPELRTPPSFRSRAEMLVNNGALSIVISSSDISSLRAAFNAYTRILYAALSTLKELGLIEE